MRTQSITTTRQATPPPLCFYQSDIEHRFGFTPREGMETNPWFAAISATVVTVCIYLILIFLPKNYWTSMFLDRGPTQHASVFFGVWCAVILLVKRSKLNLQKKTLNTSSIPENGLFVLSSQTADQVIARLHSIAVDPEHFIVYNRILITLSNLKNLGRISDVGDILRSISDRDEQAHETSFGFLNGLLWAIPVLGFIGTVIGLSFAIGDFSSLLDSETDIQSIVGSLKNVTSGLSTAFETTLLSLVIALFIQLWTTLQKVEEEQFLDRCNTYCMQQIVSKLRILPYEQSREL
jgi:biopolymer transport protein ExbB/TolQ